MPATMLERHRLPLPPPNTYVVTMVRRIASGEYRDMLVWLDTDENTRGEYCNRLTSEPTGTPVRKITWDWFFTDEKTALLFKLRWA